MTPDPPTRWQWWISNAFASVASHRASGNTFFSPIIAVIGIVLLVLVRLRESTDPEICPREILDIAPPSPPTEDRDVSNAFSAVGTLKPGLVRRTVGLFGL